MPRTRAQSRKQSDREKRAERREQFRQQVQIQDEDNDNEQNEQDIQNQILDHDENDNIQDVDEEQNQNNHYHQQQLHPFVYQFLQYRKHRPKPQYQPQGLFCGNPNNANGRPLGSSYQCLRKGFGASSSSFIRDLDAFIRETEQQ